MSNRFDINKTENPILSKSYNLILRRGDWRFLTLNPFPSKSICFGKGTLTESVKLFSETTVTAEHEENYCDLAVSTDPDSEILKKAHKELNPGGYCYSEWNVTPYTDLNSIRGKLQDLGFTNITLYMKTYDPSDSSNLLWIPLDDLNAVEYLFLLNRYKKIRSVDQRTLIWLRSLIWSISPNMVTNYPLLLKLKRGNSVISSIAQKPGNYSFGINTRPDSFANRYKNFLNKLENDYSNPDNRQKRSFNLMLTRGDENILNKVVQIVLEKERPEPFYLIKLSRTNESAHAMANEAKILKELEERAENLVRIPRVISWDHNDDFFISAETYINGIPLPKYLKTDNIHELANKVTLFLTGLAENTKSNISGDWKEYYLMSLLDDFEKSYKNVLEPSQIGKTKEVLSNIEIPFLVCEHRDMSPGNIIFNTRGEIGVIDWEGSIMDGIPCLDLIYFLIHYLPLLKENNKPKNFKDLHAEIINPDTYTGRIFDHCMNTYLKDVGMIGTNISALRLITFALYSYLSLQVVIKNNQKIDHNTPIDNKFFLLWQEEMNCI